MHIVHLIAVEADDDDEAIEAAEAGIEDYGNGDVWDWYQIGGRWEGHLDGENTCCAAKKPQIFTAALDSVAKAQERHFKELQDRFTGRQIVIKDVPDYALGFPISDKKGCAERISESNVSMKKTFDMMLGAKDLKTWKFLAQGQGADGYMLGYYLRQLAKACSGDSYHFDAYFWDTLEYTSWVDATRQRAATNPERQWLVTVDLHN